MQVFCCVFLRVLINCNLDCASLNPPLIFNHNHQPCKSNPKPNPNPKPNGVFNQIAMLKTPRETTRQQRAKKEAINNAKYCLLSLGIVRLESKVRTLDGKFVFHLIAGEMGRMAVEDSGWAEKIRLRRDGMKCLSGNFSLHKLCGKRADWPPKRDVVLLLGIQPLLSYIDIISFETLQENLKNKLQDFYFWLLLVCWNQCDTFSIVCFRSKHTKLSVFFPSLSVSVDCLAVCLFPFAHWVGSRAFSPPVRSSNFPFLCPALGTSAYIPSYTSAHIGCCFVWATKCAFPRQFPPALIRNPMWLD